MTEETEVNIKKQNIKKRNFRRTQSPQTNPIKTDKLVSRKKNVHGNHQNKSISRTQDGKNANNCDDDNDGDDDHVCVICTEKLYYVALTPCSHKTCHRCSFRQLALFNKRACLICRTEADRMIFSENVHSKFNDLFKDTTIKFIENKQYGIDFTSTDVEEATLSLLKYICPLCENNDNGNDDNNNKTDYKSYNKYRDHLKSSHNKTICMICATHNYQFPNELKIFTPNQLKNHISRGDSNDGFKGHPMCAFCSGQRFYSDDELYLHMREKHEKCHICDKIDPKSPQYFKDYNQLFSHFQTSHYICTVPACLDAKFVVFGDELELQAHILKEHGDIIRGKPKFFQSELSTFMSGPSRVVRENNVSNNFRNNSLLQNDSSNNETPEMKKIRLEERAKHYLNQSLDQFSTFQSFTQDYDKGRISATDLLNAYKTIFTSPEANIYLLIHNLSDIYPKESKKFKELDTIYTNHEQMKQRSQELPSLTSDPFIATARGSWGNINAGSHSSSSSRNASRTDLKNLPTLKAPSPNHDPFRSPYQTKTLKGSSKPVGKPLARTAIQNSNIISSNKNVGANIVTNNTVLFSTTYLQSKKSESPASLLQKSITNSGINNNSKNKLADLDLPSLPTPKRKIYPPVNKIVLPDPKNWGKDSKTSKENQLEDELSLLNIQSDRKDKKGKGKQKQLLFHIGV